LQGHRSAHLAARPSDHIATGLLKSLEAFEATGADVFSFFAIFYDPPTKIASGALIARRLCDTRAMNDVSH